MLIDIKLTLSKPTICLADFRVADPSPVAGDPDILRVSGPAHIKPLAMIIGDSDRGLGFLLTDAARLLRKLIDRRLQPLGLTRAQWSVLAILSHRDGLSQSLIADELEIEKTTAGRLIDHLENSGWVQRRPIPGDRRLWGVYMTQQARPLIADVVRIILDTRMEMLRGFAPEQQRNLSEALMAVKANLSRSISLDQPDPGALEAQGK